MRMADRLHMEDVDQLRLFFADPDLRTIGTFLSRALTFAALPILAGDKIVILYAGIAETPSAWKGHRGYLKLFGQHPRTLVQPLRSV